MKKIYCLVVLFLLSYSSVVYAQSWINWNSVAGGSTATASAANNPVSGAVTVTPSFSGTVGKPGIFYVNPAYASPQTRLDNNFDGANINTQVLGIQNSQNYNNLDKITITFANTVKIDELVITDPDRGTDTANGFVWNDSFKLSMDNSGTFSAVTSGISTGTAGGQTGVGALTAGGAIVDNNSFTANNYSNNNPNGTEWIRWTNSTGGTKTLTITYTAPKTSAATRPAVIYIALKVSTPCTPTAVTGTTSVTAGSTTQLTAAASGGTWSSSNTTVATVSSTGLVTGVNSGAATITYTNASGCPTPVTITVTNDAAVCTSIPNPVAYTGNQGTYNGVTVTKTTTGNVTTNTSAINNGGIQNLCRSSYPAGYTWLFSEASNAPASVTYTFSCPQKSVDVFLLLMGNSSQNVTNPIDIAQFSVNGSTTGFTLAEVGNYDCQNSVTVSGNTVTGNAGNNTSASDASIRVTSATPITSITITNPRYGFGTGEDTSPTLGDTSGYGYFVELCPASIVTDPVNITTQPQSQSVCLNSSVTLSTVASTPLNSPLTYQWYSNTVNSNTGGTIISGATSSTYSPPTTTGGIRYYYAVVKNGNCSTATTAVVSVTVSPTPVGGTASANQTVCPGSQPANISVSGYTGSIQWQLSTNNGATWTNVLANGTSASYTPAKPSQTTQYRAVLSSGPCAPAYSNVVTITVSASATASAPILAGNAPFSAATNSYMIACNGSTGDLSGISGTNVPAGGTLGWFNSATPSAGSRLSSITAVSPGTYYAAYYDAASGCYSPNSTAVTVYKELCVTSPAPVTVYIGAQVSRDLATVINPNGGTPNYSYSVTTGCTPPAGAAGTISGATLTGSITNYTAPTTAGTYYYCVQICDAGTPKQCKTVTVPVNVVTTPTIACDASVYLSKYDATNNVTNIYKVVHNQNSVDISLLGTSRTGIFLNNIAYNTVDSKIYGVGSHGILKVITSDPANAVVELNPGVPVSGLPQTSTNLWDYNSGGFYNGDLYVQAVGSSNVLYRINISANSATAISLNASVDLGDFVYSKVSNAFVGYDNKSHKMVKMDPTSGAVTFMPYDNSSVNELGAVYAGNLGHVYGKDGTTGKLYEFNLNTGQAFQIYQDNQFIMTQYDGAHCTDANVVFPADVQVVKTAASPNYVPGQQVSYTIVVTNNSSLYAVNNIQVQDTMPASLTNVRYYAVPSTGATTTVSQNQSAPSTGNINDTVYLPTGGTMTYYVTATASTTGGVISNTANIVVPSNFSDPNTANNTSKVDISTSVCYKGAQLTGSTLETQHGITAFQRAGANSPDGWPMVRRGAYTALEANGKGFVINRLTTAQLNKIVSDGKAVEGMAAYDVTANCFKIYDGTSFKCYTIPSCDQ